MEQGWFRRWVHVTSTKKNEKKKIIDAMPEILLQDDVVSTHRSLQHIVYVSWPIWYIEGTAHMARK